jgi:hypothetical protein
MSWPKIILLRVAAPGVLALLMCAAALGLQSDTGNGAHLRNVLLPAFVMVVLWQAAVTLTEGARERRKRNLTEVPHDEV